MRIVQSLLALALCGAVAYWLGVIYCLLVLATMFVALGTGVAREGLHRLEDLVVSIAIGFVWPMLIVALVMFLVSSGRTAKLAASAPARTGEAGSTAVEDA